jgi:hypothetical protein
MATAEEHMETEEQLLRKDHLPCISVGYQSKLAMVSVVGNALLLPNPFVRRFFR